MALMLDYMHGRTVEDETEYDTLFLPLGLSDFVSLSLSLSGGKDSGGDTRVAARHSWRHRQCGCCDVGGRAIEWSLESDSCGSYARGRG